MKRVLGLRAGLHGLQRPWRVWEMTVFLSPVFRGLPTFFGLVPHVTPNSASSITPFLQLSSLSFVKDACDKSGATRMVHAELPISIFRLTTPAQSLWPCQKTV